MTEQDRRAVVVAVAVGRQREHQPVDLGGGDADGEAGGAGGYGGARQVHDARRDVAVQITVERVGDGGGGAGEGAHLADHGEDGGEWGVRVGLEGDVEDGCGVDDGVDRVEVVLSCWDGLVENLRCR